MAKSEVCPLLPLDEYRIDYDPGRGGLGKQAQVENLVYGGATGNSERSPERRGGVNRSGKPKRQYSSSEDSSSDRSKKTKFMEEVYGKD